MKLFNCNQDVSPVAGLPWFCLIFFFFSCAFVISFIRLNSLALNGSSFWGLIGNLYNYINFVFKLFFSAWITHEQNVIIKLQSLRRLLVQFSLRNIHWGQKKSTGNCSLVNYGGRRKIKNGSLSCLCEMQIDRSLNLLEWRKQALVSEVVIKTKQLLLYNTHRYRQGFKSHCTW